MIIITAVMAELPLELKHYLLQGLNMQEQLLMRELDSDFLAYVNETTYPTANFVVGLAFAIPLCYAGLTLKINNIMK